MLHIIQNDPEVLPGNILDALTIPYVVHHPYRGEPLPNLDDISALIVLGGAMGANDDVRHPFLTELKKLILALVAAGTPYLGVCLGGQLLAAALGARVASRRWGEQGTHSVSLTCAGKTDPLFAGLAEEFVTFQWHNDSFDIPEGGVLLASSTLCPHQAFRINKNAWGIQFHPEVTDTIIRKWCALDSVTAKRTEVLVTDFSGNEEAYRATSRKLINNFLQANLHE